MRLAMRLVPRHDCARLIVNNNPYTSCSYTETHVNSCEILGILASMSQSVMDAGDRQTKTS